MKKPVYFLGIILLVFNSIIAQNTINTDRPDQSDGSHIVETGYLQVESGVQFSKDDATKSFDNVTLIRYGVTKKFEIRFINQYSTIRDDGNSVSGFQPFTISFKNQLCDQHGLLPKLTLVSYFKLPITVSPAFKGEHVGFTFTLVARHELSPKLKLYSNLGVSKDQENLATSYLETEELNYSITDKLSAYAEYFGNYAIHESASNGLDIGFIYALKNNLAIDLALGSPTLNLNVNRFLSFGMSVRMPK